jgi:hypothetical protein
MDGQGVSGAIHLGELVFDPLQTLQRFKNHRLGSLLWLHRSRNVGDRRVRQRTYSVTALLLLVAVALLIILAEIFIR